jgi:hypothetical protein
MKPGGDGHGDCCLSPPILKTTKGGNMREIDIIELGGVLFVVVFFLWFCFIGF